MRDSVCIIPLLLIVNFEEVLDIYSDASTTDVIHDETMTLPTADVSDEENSPVFHFERHVALFKEIYHMLWIGSVIDMTPAMGSAAFASMSLKLPYTAVLKNAAHQRMFLECLESKVLKAMSDTSDTRFYTTNADLGISAEGEEATAEAGDGLE